MREIKISSIVDISRYPIDNLDSSLGRKLVQETKTQLNQDGSCTFDDFLVPDALDKMCAEALTLSDLAYPGPTSVSPYFFNYSLGEDFKHDDTHPTQHKGKRNLKQVAADLIPENHLLRVLYRSSEMTSFLGQVLDQPVYQFKDKYQSLNISVMDSGGCQQWHFDSGQLVTTLLLQSHHFACSNK